MRVVETELPGCWVLEPKILADERGYFYETWNKDVFAGLGLNLEFKQANISSSARGVLRGLHYQWPKPQGKLVHMLEGEVYDVAVDIRQDSPTFGRSTSVILSADNKRQFWIPPGFAHGFVVLSERATFSYLCTETYNPEYDAGLRWDDASLAIDWPVSKPILSSKDAKAPFLCDISPKKLPRGEA
ncbi:MAG: dTDP-4-dehydrorhamnose 3,5-epimerase [Arenimonas sp.]